MSHCLSNLMGSTFFSKLEAQGPPDSILLVGTVGAGCLPPPAPLDLLELLDHTA